MTFYGISMSKRVIPFFHISWFLAAYSTNYHLPKSDILVSFSTTFTNPEGTPKMTVFEHPLRNDVFVFFLRILNFLGGQFFFYSTQICYISYFPFNIWCFRGVKRENALFFSYFYSTIVSKTFRVVYVK